MKWLWIECNQFTVTIDLNENDTIIAVPPELSHFVGKHRSLLEFHLKAEFPDIEIQEKGFNLNANT